MHAVGQTMEETLIGVSKAELVEAEMEGAFAQITVKFLSDQVHALRAVSYTHLTLPTILRV